MPSTSAGYRVPKPAALAAALFSVMLLAVNFALVRQNRGLKLRLAVHAPSLLPPIGAIMPPLEGLDSSGSRVAIGYKAPYTKTLLFIFSPACDFCSQNWPNWVAISRDIESRSVRVAYVNLMGRVPADYLRRWGVLSANLVEQVDPKSLVSYNLRYTPETILLDGSGRIVDVWEGVLDTNQVRRIENLLKWASPRPESYSPRPMELRVKGERRL
jgi:hypothetical protein